MNTYHAFYKGKKIELVADSSYQAQRKASEIFKTYKAYDITIVLVAIEGKAVTHIPTF
jgi:hypothetical protein